MMEKIIDRIPESMATAYMSSRSKDKHRSSRRVYFGNDMHLRWPDLANSRSSVDYVLKECFRLEQYRGLDGTLPPSLAHLLRGLLQLDPSHRLSASSGMLHSYFSSWSQKDHDEWLDMRSRI